MRLIFLGPPGAGKGTQAQILEQRCGVMHISTGDILRENRSRGTELGKCAEQFMRSGALVPDEIIINMIEVELGRLSDGFIMDGFPRTVAQAQAFDAMLDRKGMPLDAVVLFNADRPSLFTRLAGRWTNPRTGRTYNSVTNPPNTPGIDDDDHGPLVQRDDDQPETVNKRLDVYEQQTAPLVDYYKRAGKLIDVDALAPVSTVTEQILAKLRPVKAAQ